MHDTEEVVVLLIALPIEFVNQFKITLNHNLLSIKYIPDAAAKPPPAPPPTAATIAKEPI